MTDQTSPPEVDETHEEQIETAPEVEDYNEPDEAPVVEEDEAEGNVENGGGGR